MSTINWINFKDLDSRDFGLFVRKKTAYDKAERDITFVSVPGRSGDLIIDNGKFKNIPIEYELSLFSTQHEELSENENFFYSLEDVCRWLTEDGKYYKLYNSYEPLYYRWACLTKGITMDDQEHWSVGKFGIKFNCKPFRYRIDGDEVQIFTTQSHLYNSEIYDSLPYIKIYGSGDIYLHINGRQYDFLNVSGYVECDSETMNVYKNTVNKNNDFRANSYPVLEPGSNNISWAGNVQKIEIIPRWRTR